MVEMGKIGGQIKKQYNTFNYNCKRKGCKAKGRWADGCGGEVRLVR